MSTVVGSGQSMTHPAFRYGEAEHAHYLKHGYFIFDHFLTDDAMAACQDNLQRMVRDVHPTCTPEAIISPHQLGERWIWDLATEPRLLNMIERQIGPNIVLWSSHVLAKPPRTGIEVRWHQDAPYWNIGGLLAGAVWIPLDDADEDNGTMSILPDWHQRGVLSRLVDRASSLRPGEHERLFDEAIDPEALPSDVEELKITYRVQAGQMATHDTMLPHCSMPNRSDRWRRILVFRYMAADGTLGKNTYTDFRNLEPFDRQFFLVRGQDVSGHGLPTSPFAG